MLDKPQIIQTTRQSTAMIHLPVPREEIRNVMGPGLSELMAATAAGPWFTHHLKMDPEIVDWIEANGHRPAPDLWERYVAGPESSPDPAAWRTELNRPLIS